MKTTPTPARDSAAKPRLPAATGSSAARGALGLNTKSGESSKNDIEFNGRMIEAVLLLLEGDIDLNKISKLTDQMDLPGGKQLKKAQQKKSL